MSTESEYGKLLFSIPESYKYAARLIAKNLKEFAVIFLVWAAVGYFLFFSNVINTDNKTASFFDMIVYFMCYIICSFLFIKSILILSSDGKLTIDKYLSSVPIFPRYFLSYILYLMIFSAGLFLLIIGRVFLFMLEGILIFGVIYFCLKLFFVNFLIIDKNDGVWTSIKNSFKLTDDAIVEMFLLWLPLFIPRLVYVILYIAKVVKFSSVYANAIDWLAIPFIFLVCIYPYHKLTERAARIELEELAEKQKELA